MEDADDANEISQREMTEARFDLSWRDQSLFVQKIQEIHEILGPEEARKQIKLLENPYAKSIGLSTARGTPSRCSPSTAAKSCAKERRGKFEASGAASVSTSAFV